MTDHYVSDQDLINSLYAALKNEKRARERGDARSIKEYKTLIDGILSALENRGYCRLQCLKDCED